MELHREQWGHAGPPVLFVHGSVTNGETTWLQQRPLADGYQLHVLDRRGYFPNPPIDREDFDVDAGDVALVLGAAGASGMHLVGHSYGAVVSLVAAARRPSLVRSLTVIEPPAFGIVTDDPVVEDFTRWMDRYWSTPGADPEAFLRGFLARVGSAAQLPSPLPAPLLQAARLLMVERSPAEAVIPLDELRRAPFPKLVVSGAHSRVFDAVCDVLEDALGAERVVVAGAGHSVPRTGEPFNQQLRGFIDRAEESAGQALPEGPRAMLG
jgi:pimeloyl-ACP methyl ester carboxylesterase